VSRRGVPATAPLGNKLNPAILQKVLSSVGLAMDMVGATLVAAEAVRRFKGIKTTLGQTYGTFLNPPEETEEFKAWNKTNFRFSICGLVLLFLGFLLQFASNWVTTPQPSPVTTSELFALKARCAEAGRATRKALVTDYHYNENLLGDAEYAYNQRLNTCLYADSYNLVGKIPAFPNTEVRHWAFVQDLSSNKILVEYEEHDSKTAGPLSKEEFKKRKRELMSGQ
jgi:hypothetical protein